jgi:hypothetical protein
MGLFYSNKAIAQLSDCNPVSCNPKANFSVVLTGTNATFTLINSASPSYTVRWKFFNQSGTLLSTIISTTPSNFPATFNFPATGIFRVVCELLKDGNPVYTCCRQLTIPTATLDCGFQIIGAHTACSRPYVTVRSNDTDPNHRHNYIFANGQSAVLQNSGEVTFQLNDFNTYIHNLMTVTHQITDLSGNAIGLPCNSQFLWSTFGVSGIFIGRDCETHSWKEYMTAQNPYVGLTTETIGQDIYFLGTIDYDEFSLSSSLTNFFPGQSAKFRIANTNHNVEFSAFNEVHFRTEADCDCRWTGIEVHNGTRIFFNHFGVDLPERISIEDAVYGIRVINEIPNSGSAPSLRLTNVDFLSNFMAIRASDGEYGLLRFRNNVIDGNQKKMTMCACAEAYDLAPDYPSPYNSDDGYAGIFQKNVRLNIFQTEYTNTFQDLAAGILMESADANIRSCRFENITRGEDYHNMAGDCQILNSGVGVRFLDATKAGRTLNMFGLLKEPTFNVVEHGVHVSGAGNNTSGFVFDCIMNNVQRGIDFTSPNDPTLRSLGNVARGQALRNEIHVDRLFGVDMNPFCTGAFGIGFFDMNMAGSFFDARENTIIVDVDRPNKGVSPVGIVAAGSNTFTPPPNSTPILNNSAVLEVFGNNITVNRGIEGIRVDNFASLDLPNTNQDIGAEIHGNYVNLSVNQQSNPFGTNPYSSSYLFGIKTSGGNGVITECNDVINTIPTQTAYNTAFQADGVPNARTFMNNFTGTRYGTEFLNAGGGTFFGCNDHTGPMEFGLLIGSGNSICGPQFNTGNRWIDFPSNPNDNIGNSFGTSATNSNLSPGTSLFTTNPTNFLTPPGVIIPLSGWFDVNSTNPSNHPDKFGCFCLDEEFTGGGTDKSLEHKIANGEVGGFNPAIIWALDRYLYRKANDFPDLSLSIDGLDHFLNVQSDKSVGRFERVRKEMEALFVPDASLSTEFSNYQTAIADKLTEIVSLEAVLVDEINNISLSSELSGKQQELNNLQQEAEIIAQKVLDLRNEKANEVIDHNNAIEISTDYEANQQIVNDYLLHVIAQGKPANEDQNAKIADIAYQCPEKGGMSVYEARSLLQWLEGQMLTFDDCYETPVGNRSDEKTIVQVENIEVYPNPASEFIVVSLKQDESVHFTLRDAQGRVILSRDMVKTETQVNTQNLAKGVFFWDAKSSINGKQYMGKIVIIH